MNQNVTRAIKKKILIVDDDMDDCEMLIEVIREIDPTIECECSHYCEEALDHLRTKWEELPWLIFVDLNMPRMKGTECLTEIKKDARLKHIHVAIYSTSSDPRDMQETRQLGATYYITKPRSVQELHDEIRMLMKLHETAQSV